MGHAGLFDGSEIKTLKPALSSAAHTSAGYIDCVAANVGKYILCRAACSGLSQSKYGDRRYSEQAYLAPGFKTRNISLAQSSNSSFLKNGQTA